jgi:hypothetical protein
MPTIRKCIMDGFCFDWEPTLVPIEYDREQQKFIYENNVFCSPACAKGWLFRDVHNNTDRLQLFSLYCKKVLNVCGHITMCPDPRFIREYMFDPEKGITIATFRAQHQSHILATGFKHVCPSVDQTVYLEEVKDDVGEMDETYTG